MKSDYQLFRASLAAACKTPAIHEKRRRSDTPLDWRWREAWAHVSPRPGVRQRLRADPGIHAAVVYLKGVIAEPELDWDQLPVAKAIKIFRQDEQICWKLEALILARQRTKAIATRLQILPDVALLYEAIFFDIRPRLRYPSSVNELFGYSPHLGFAEDDLGTLWKWLAYHRGVHALDLALAVTIGEGRENFSQTALDDATVFIEQARIRTVGNGRRLLQLSARFEAEARGLPPSAYHLAGRTRRVNSPEFTKWMESETKFVWEPRSRVPKTP
jgi:hypothetical protein